MTPFLESDTFVSLGTVTTRVELLPGGLLRYPPDPPRLREDPRLTSVNLARDTLDPGQTLIMRPGSIWAKQRPPCTLPLRLRAWVALQSPYRSAYFLASTPGDSGDLAPLGAFCGGGSPPEPPAKSDAIASGVPERLSSDFLRRP